MKQVSDLSVSTAVAAVVLDEVIIVVLLVGRFPCHQSHCHCPSSAAASILLFRFGWVGSGLGLRDSSIVQSKKMLNLEFGSAVILKFDRNWNQNS